MDRYIPIKQLKCKVRLVSKRALQMAARIARRQFHPNEEGAENWAERSM